MFIITGCAGLPTAAIQLARLQQFAHNFKSKPDLSALGNLNPMANHTKVLEVTSSYARHSQSRAQHINKITIHERQNMPASNFFVFLLA